MVLLPGSHSRSDEIELHESGQQHQKELDGDAVKRGPLISDRNWQSVFRIAAILVGVSTLAAASVILVTAPLSAAPDMAPSRDGPALPPTPSQPRLPAAQEPSPSLPWLNRPPLDTVTLQAPASSPVSITACPAHPPLAFAPSPSPCPPASPTQLPPCCSPTPSPPRPKPFPALLPDSPPPSIPPLVPPSTPPPVVSGVGASAVRPSIILLVADGWRANAFSAAAACADCNAESNAASARNSDPLAHTPHLSALRDSPTTVAFANAYTTKPVCVPGRASLLSGRYPDAHAAYHNGAPLWPDVPTVSSVLSAHGYRCELVGKWHLAGEHCPSADTDCLAVDDAAPLALRHGFTSGWAQDACLRASAPRDGSWMHSACLLTDANYGAGGPSGSTAVHGRGGGSGRLFPRDEAYEPTFYTDIFLQRLERLRSTEADAPFLAMLSLRPPHNPFRAPQTFSAPIEALLPADTARTEELRPGLIPPASDSSSSSGAWRAAFNARAVGYFGSIAALDAEFGRVLAAVDGYHADGAAPYSGVATSDAAESAMASMRANRSVNVTRPLLVIFTSDHGTQHHEHGSRENKKEPWQESIRIPILIRLPPALLLRERPMGAVSIGSAAGGARPPLRWTPAATIADLAPTILGLVGISSGALCGGCDGACADGIDLSAGLRACATRGACPSSPSSPPHSSPPSSALVAGGSGEGTAVGGSRFVRLGRFDRRYETAADSLLRFDRTTHNVSSSSQTEDPATSAEIAQYDWLGVASDSLKAVIAPHLGWWPGPVLFDLQRDPHELRPILPTDRDPRTAEMVRLLRAEAQAARRSQDARVSACARLPGFWESTFMLPNGSLRIDYGTGYGTLP